MTQELAHTIKKNQNPTFTCFKQPFSEGVSSHETTFQEFKDETNLGKKRTVLLRQEC